MNVERLISALHALKSRDNRLQLQKKFSVLAQALESFSKNPTHADHRQAVQKRLAELRAGLEAEPDLQDLGIAAREGDFDATQFFNLFIVDELARSFEREGITPAILQRALDVTNARMTFLGNVDSALRALTALGFKVSTLPPGHAEIGFLVPRPLFDNELPDLIKELRFLRLLLSTFSEIVTGGQPKIIVGEISASDPVFFFGLDVTTAVAVGGLSLLA